jgi:murein DD-endopeptidase MepM/ murein hydrolase activator NlpD
MKALLLFLAGLLVGANVVYFYVSRHCPAPPASQPVPAAPATSTPQSPLAATARPGAAPVRPIPPTTTPSTVASAPVAASPAPSATSAIAGPTGLLLPVAGILPSQLTDTFTDARGGGTRAHEALDIMAPRGTPVLAAADGKVVKLFTSVRGGLTIYQFDPSSTFAYYYAHLDRYAPGLAEGRELRRGEVIGYVGSTGDASPEAPHLHFSIFVLGPEKQWWKGTAIDPYPLLASAPTGHK